VRPEYACADEVVQAPAPERLIESGVGDGAAEWVVCEPIVHLAPAGPSRAAY
jgi:glycerol dehydrogenase-like iron-containing ADH family enzyme